LWLEARKADLLPAPYFHVVFTLPEPVAAIAPRNKRAVYDILFRSTAATLRTIAADPRHLGAEIGFVAVPHTWGQTLQHHPHLHCVVPGGGLAPDGQRRVACRPGFFLPVRALSSLFRRLFLEALDQVFRAGELAFRGSLADLNEAGRPAEQPQAARGIDWAVHAKPPFGGPEQALDCLGRYTHRVAIANSRLTEIGDSAVSFGWKDYRHHDRRTVMTLDAHEFIRRFLLRALPDGFQRIRHYGLLGNRGRQAKLARCRQLLDAPPPRRRCSPRWPTRTTATKPWPGARSMSAQPARQEPCGASRSCPPRSAAAPVPFGPTRHDAAPQPPTVIVRRAPARPRPARRAGLAAIRSSPTLVWAPRIGAMPGSNAANIPQSSPPPAAAMPETPHQPICGRLGAATLKRSP